MLKLKAFSTTGNILSMSVLIEGNEKEIYKLSVDTNSDFLSVAESDIPFEKKIYERQARTALLNYKSKELPDEITSVWY